MHSDVTRRQFLGASSTLTAATLLAQQGKTAEADAKSLPATPGKIPRVAGINSIYRFRSHAYHIEGRIIHGYTRNGFHHQPRLQLVRMYNDQYPTDDLSKIDCPKHDVQICKTAAEAIGGEKGLDVDGVLLIVEHGDYPLNEFNQILYPRYQLFEQVVEVFRKSGRSVPVFVDKHLSYDHKLAHKMVATARELGFPLMAGSSLPVTWRIPVLEPPLGTPFQEGLGVFGYERGAVEIYLFHILEAMQCMLERRSGGETGVKSVRAIQGPAVWEAGDAGVWSWDLLRAALATTPTSNVGPLREIVRNPLAVIIEYADGTKGTVLNLIEATSDLAFAGRVKGLKDPLATYFHLPGAPGAKFFNPLTYHIEQFIDTGKPPYPVERTLLTSTLCDLGLRSLKAGGKFQESPLLNVRYQAPVDSGFFKDAFTDAGY
ncbi:MAG: hypothetical protein JWM11_944 [Planctomycetaceae bacterium]|nr:hypothetical protein [Planctomycetaceae bacterium]